MLHWDLCLVKNRHREHSMPNRKPIKYRPPKFTKKMVNELGREESEREKHAKERAQNLRAVLGLIFLCIYITYIYFVDGIRLSDYLDPADSEFWFGTVPIFVVVWVVLKVVERIARRYYD